MMVRHSFESEKPVLENSGHLQRLGQELLALPMVEGEGKEIWRLP